MRSKAAAAPEVVCTAFQDVWATAPLVGRMLAKATELAVVPDQTRFRFPQLA
jgi:hypothetical protein